MLYSGQRVNCRHQKKREDICRRVVRLHCAIPQCGKTKAERSAKSLKFDSTPTRCSIFSQVFRCLSVFSARQHTKTNGDRLTDKSSESDCTNEILSQSQIAVRVKVD